MKPLAIHTCGESFGGELSPEALALVRATDNPEAPPADQTNIRAAREGHALAAYDLDVPLEGMHIQERFIPTNGKELRVRIYTPAAPGPLPVLVFAHGGCWTFCSLDSHDPLCRFYAQAGAAWSSRSIMRSLRNRPTPKAWTISMTPSFGVSTMQVKSEETPPASPWRETAPEATSARRPRDEWQRTPNESSACNS